MILLALLLSFPSVNAANSDQEIPDRLKFPLEIPLEVYAEIVMDDVSLGERKLISSRFRTFTRKEEYVEYMETGGYIEMLEMYTMETIYYAFELSSDDFCYQGAIDYSFQFEEDAGITLNLVVHLKEHNWEWITDAEPSCIPGKKHEECPDCHMKRNEDTVISAVQEHDYVFDEIKWFGSEEEGYTAARANFHCSVCQKEAQ